MRSSGGHIPSFKDRVPFDVRLRDALNVRAQHLDKVPIVIERYEGENSLPVLPRCKYLVPSHITIAELMQIVRKRMDLHWSQSFFMFVRNKSLISNSMTVGELYHKEVDDDGFLYISYATQLAFGFLE
ncbi:unnamed protein product [Dracunculus medinensis]|uniref:Autophagy-related protein n=1 Tax=Dracunculus medinensis TaxID=318479 RepID=A0A0N4U852_DRAME|nr:unnamed protein product [Dracunculus medinensis]